MIHKKYGSLIAFKVYGRYLASMKIKRKEKNVDAGIENYCITFTFCKN